ncbi:MAG TPA: hypothetical protein VK761_03675, partial [Solirubrobacteraceae bacterium]|nr:hypothetical protein [Solirubrobacteraceae bacterium]
MERRGASPTGGQRAPGQKSPEDGPRARLMLWAPWAVLAVIALVGAIVTSSSVVEIICFVVLAIAATLLGWAFGESRRTALEEEIDGRSYELRRALSELEVAQTET